MSSMKRKRGTFFEYSPFITAFAYDDVTLLSVSGKRMSISEVAEFLETNSTLFYNSVH